MDLYTVWENYTAASTRSAVNDFGLAPPPNPVNIGIDSARFLKLCKDGKLIGRSLRNQDIDVIFCKYAKQRRLDFGAFQDALVEVSLKKNVDGETLVENLLNRTRDGPSIKGTAASPSRFHDDKSTYTGVYKAGGPTTIDYEKLSLSDLTNRKKIADIRGVPRVATEGPGGVNSLMAESLPISPYINTPEGTIESQLIGVGGVQEAKSESIRSQRISNLNARFGPDAIAKIKQIYASFTLHCSKALADTGIRPPNPVAVGIDSARFCKLIKDGKVLSKKFRIFDLDIVFKRHAAGGGRKLNGKGLMNALTDIASKKGIDKDALVDSIYSNTNAGNYNLTGTTAESNRFHDDKTTYTGVYKAGGPTTIDYDHVNFAQLINRSNKASVKGVPKQAINGPSEKFSTDKNQHMKSLKRAQGHYSMRAHSHGYSTKVVGEHGYNQPAGDDNSASQQQQLALEKASRGFSGKGLAAPSSVLGKFAFSKSDLRTRQQSAKIGGSPIPDYVANARQKYNNSNKSKDTKIEGISIYDGASHKRGASPGGSGTKGGRPQTVFSTLTDSIAEDGSDDDVDDVYMNSDTLTSGGGVTTGDNEGDEGDVDDMEITPSQLECMTIIYEQYEMHSRSYKDQQKMLANKREGAEVDIYYGDHCGVDSSKFLKLCLDAKLFDSHFKKTQVDILFARHKNHDSRKLNFEGFQNTLLEIAVRKTMALGMLINKMASLAESGPSLNQSTKTDKMANHFATSKSDSLNYKQSNTSVSLENDGPNGTNGTNGNGNNGNSSASNTLELDMSISQLQLEEFGLVYDSYERASRSDDEGIDSARFLKLCKDVKLFDENYTRADGDILFAKYKSQKNRKLDFEALQEVIVEVAKRKQTALSEIIDSIDYYASGGPDYSSGTTQTESNKFYDDQSTYTGQYKQGGPEMRDHRNSFINSFRKDN